MIVMTAQNEDTKPGLPLNRCWQKSLPHSNAKNRACVVAIVTESNAENFCCLVTALPPSDDFHHRKFLTLLPS